MTACSDKKSGAKIQDAHEAVRPTDINLTPVKIKDSISRDLFRLYQLIWQRFTASQMAQAVYATKGIKIKAGEYYFTVSGSHIIFDGFMSVYKEDDEKEDSDKIIAALKKGDELELKRLEKNQHFTHAGEWLVKRT